MSLRQEIKRMKIVTKSCVSKLHERKIKKKTEEKWEVYENIDVASL